MDYEVAGGTVRVRLSDLGRSLEDTPDDDCYREDGDNQIDVVLSGDEDAARSITHVEMPDLPRAASRSTTPAALARTRSRESPTAPPRRCCCWR